MTVADKLETIKNSLQAIKNAVISKGQTPSGNITTYADAINAIAVKGPLMDLTVDPAVTQQVFIHPITVDGYNKVTVNAVTSSIDSDIKSANIKSGVNILGVTGNVVELKGQTKTITEVGEYTPDSGYNGFTKVTVNMPASSKFGASLSSFIGDIDANGTLQAPTETTNFVFTGVEDIGNYVLRCFTYGQGDRHDNIKSVSFPNLVSISGVSALEGSFTLCTQITAISFPSLTSITGASALLNAFHGCVKITSVEFPALEQITGLRAFEQTFANCTNITSISFPALKLSTFDEGVDISDQFRNIVAGVSNCTIAFPMNFSGLLNTATFGGTNTTILCDLPATEPYEA